MWVGEAYEVLEYNFVRMQQRRPTAQTKIRNLKTGAVSIQSFKQSDTFNELEIERRKAIFLYGHRGEYVFHLEGDPRSRFTVPEAILSDKTRYLKPNTPVDARYIESELLDIIIPIKMDLKVTEAPPGVQGDRSNSGNKSVTLETGAIIQVPLFINTDDIVRVNTDTGEYTERVSKA